MLTPPRDIRNFVPQINPTWLPQPPIGAKYPRMMTKEEESGKRVPYKLPNGKPVIVQNEKEEQEFWAKHKGEQPKTAAAMSVSAEPQETSEDVTDNAPQSEVVGSEERRGPGRPRKVVLPD